MVDARRRILVSSTLTFSLLSIAAAAWAAPPRSSARPARSLVPASREATVLSSNRSSTSFKATAGVDSFYIYGGPGSLLGKFQTAGLSPDRQGWTSYDVTDQQSFWQPHTFNSPTSSVSMWAGRTAAQATGWASPPGYGNSWNALLGYRSIVSDPSVAQTVGLNFVFNHDTEPTYDFFDVEYDSAGVSIRVLHLDGSNKDSGGVFVPTNYAAQLPEPIVYEANGYAGSGGDEIVIRLALRSDGAWSDEDALFPSDGGAQVDDITVSHLDDTDFEDFEGPEQGFLWQPERGPYSGNFGELFTLLNEVDPCRENQTPGLGFIDDGRGPYNPRYTGTGTGGTLSMNWSYGIAGGWVVNYSGGISAGLLDLHNEWWSPEIDWDIPDTSADDAVEVVGATLRFSVWNHLPLLNGFFYQWAVRGYEQGVGWQSWGSRNFVYYSNDQRWQLRDLVVTDLIPPNKEKVQIKFGVVDLANLFAFQGTDATPAPIFDNVSLVKYAVPGPNIVAREIDLLQDSFSQGGGFDVSTREARDLLDVRVDMARDVNTGIRFAVPGDSIVVDVASMIPGVGIAEPLQQITMHYSLNMNPLFEAEIRENAPVTAQGTGINDWDQQEGAVAASQTTIRAGIPIEGRYFFDLPDADFMYPGDVLEFFIRAEDDAGNVTTLPADMMGFDDLDTPYDRGFTMRALPSYTNPDGYHAELLVWNDAGRGVGDQNIVSTFDDLNGMTEGVHYDSYTTAGSSSLVSNGLGSAGAHGATVDQLDGYGWIIYEGGGLSSGLINAASAYWGDKGDDAALLQSWWSRPEEDRSIAHFADNLATDLNASTGGRVYLSSVINATLVSSDVRPQLGGQTAPRVAPSGNLSIFNYEFIAYGGCPGINRFDHVTPGGGSFATHEFMNSSGSVPLANASIYNATTDGFGGVHQSLLFPFGLVYVQEIPSKIRQNASASAKLMEEVLYALDGGHLIPRIDDAPPQAPKPSLEIHPPHPNPFNPETILSFDLGRAAKGSVKIYNLRGALVRTLAEGDFSGGPNTLGWRGEDNTGAQVSSGVYLVSYQIDGFEETQKILMLK